jgi:hypothetical protein
MPGDLISRPLIEIARELRERRATARELVEAGIARHARPRPMVVCMWSRRIIPS